jgi:perosamine synthetase
MSIEKLALNGGSPVRSDPMPSRSLFGEEEKAAAIAVFDAAIEAGEAFGYNGPKEEAYTEAFAQFLGGGYADAVNSGTNALFVALGSLGLDALSEVIVPPISDPGGVMPVIFCGCVPVAADAEPGTYNIGVAGIESRITERTRAIVVAHITGEPAEMDAIMTLAAKHSLYVVEDCAQSHGATYKGKKVGTFGHAAAFSTMFGKHHATGGQGGVFFSVHEDVFWKGRRFADRGKPFNIEDASGNVAAGLNCNLDELSAAIGITQLAKLESIITRRRKFAESLFDALEARCKFVRPGRRLDGAESVYWFLRLKLDENACNADKSTFCQALAAEGIPVNPSYRHIPVEMPWFTNKATFGTNGFPWNCSDYAGDRSPVFDLPNAVRSTEEHFNMQINERFGNREVDDIVAAILKVEAAYS